MTRLLLLIAMLAACASAPSYPPPPYEVAGVPIAYVEDRTLDSPSAARWRQGLPEVGWNPFLWQHEEDVEKVFDLAHERCHFAAWTSSELEADCCAVRRMKHDGYLPAGWLAELVAEAMDWRGDAKHPDGVERAVHIMECAQ